MVLKTREKIMVVLAAAVVLYFAVDFLVLGPQQKGIKAKQAQLKELQEKMTVATGTLPELSALRTRVEGKNGFWIRLKKRLWAKINFAYSWISWPRKALALSWKSIP